MNKEKPIIFSTDMLKAIKAGKKNQTRRVVKIPSWTWDKFNDLKLDEHGNLMAVSRKMGYPEAINQPYAVGDVLWVREAFSEVNDCVRYAYRADEPEVLWGDTKWKPAIHMPRNAARIFLWVVSIRAERLQDISEEDAKAEGANLRDGKNVGFEEKMRRSEIERFADLWDGLNADRRLGWEVNPWVWVVEFERVENYA